MIKPARRDPTTTATQPHASSRRTEAPPSLTADRSRTRPGRRGASERGSLLPTSASALTPGLDASRGVARPRFRPAPPYCRKARAPRLIRSSAWAPRRWPRRPPIPPSQAPSSLVAGAWLGSLLPDADRAGSQVYRPTRFERRVWPARIVGGVARLPLRALSVLRHRGITHSLAAAAIAAAVSGLVVSRIAPTAALAVGREAWRSATARTSPPTPAHPRECRSSRRCPAGGGGCCHRSRASRPAVRASSPSPRRTRSRAWLATVLLAG